MKLTRGIAWVGAGLLLGALVGCQENNETTAGIKPLGHVGTKPEDAPPRTQKDYYKRYQQQQKSMSDPNGEYAKSVGGAPGAPR